MYGDLIQSCFSIVGILVTTGRTLFYSLFYLNISTNSSFKQPTDTKLILISKGSTLSLIA